MRQLFILRHAKPSWNDPRLEDIDRPLTEEGKQDSIALGQYMARENMIPDIILCSSAVRAVQTLDGIIAGLDDRLLPDHEIARDKGMYLTGAGSLYEKIKGVPERFDTILLIAHNPDVHNLAVNLIQDGPADHIQKLHQGYPAGALCVLECPCNRWGQLELGKNRLEMFLSPRDLPETM